MTFRDDVEAELANPIDRPVGAGSRDGRDGESEPASPCVVKPGREALVETWQALLDPQPVPVVRVGPSWLDRLPEGGLVPGRLNVVGGAPGIGNRH